MDMWTKDIEQKLNQNHQDRLKADIEKHLARKQEEEERLKSEQLMRSGIVGGIMSIFSTKEAEENAKVSAVAQLRGEDLGVDVCVRMRRACSWCFDAHV